MCTCKMFRGSVDHNISSLSVKFLYFLSMVDKTINTPMSQDAVNNHLQAPKTKKKPKAQNRIYFLAKHLSSRVKIKNKE